MRAVIFGTLLAIAPVAAADACDLAGPNLLKDGGFSRPIDGQVMSSFGMRRDPISGTMKMHTGVDYGSEIGSPVRASAAGRVARAGEDGEYGKIVALDHGGGLQTRYAHLSRIDVREGDCVER